MNNDEPIDCIKNSELYKSSEDLDGCIPPKYSPEWIYDIDKLDIKNSKELRHVIDILRFWMVNKLPHVLYEYVYNITQSYVSTLNNDYEEMTKVLNDNNFHDFKLVKELVVISKEKEHKRPIQTARKARINKSSNLLDFLKNKNYYFDFQSCSYYFYNLPESEKFQKTIELFENNQIPKEKISVICISKHPAINLQLLKYFKNEIKNYLDKRKWNTIYIRAITHNDFESFKYLCIGDILPNKLVKKYTGEYMLYRYLGKYADLKYFKFLHENNLMYQDILNCAIEDCNLDIVKYLYENGYRLDTSKYTRIVFKNIDNLKYMSSVGYYICNKNIRQFIHLRYLDCVKFSVENRQMTQYDVLAIIKDACGYFDAITNDVVFEERKECIKYLIDKHDVDMKQGSRIIEKLAKIGYKQMIKWFLELGCPINQEALNHCLDKNYINILRLLCNSGATPISNSNHVYHSPDNNIFNKIVTIKCSNQKTNFQYSRYRNTGLRCRHAKHKNSYECKITRKPHYYKSTCCCDKCGKIKYEKSFECLKYVHENHDFTKIVQNQIKNIVVDCHQLIEVTMEKQNDQQKELDMTCEKLQEIETSLQTQQIKSIITNGIRRLKSLNNQASKDVELLNDIIDNLGKIVIKNNVDVVENNFKLFNLVNRNITKIASDNDIQSKIKDLRSLMKHLVMYVWNEETFNLAAEYGNLKCLKYLYKHGCPYNKEEACRRAGEYSHIKCIMYMLKNQFMEIPLLKKI